jgi:hypothetical protein
MQAIKQAVDGDTIQVLSGIYEENIVIETSVYIKPVPGEEVTIRSENLATINCSAMTAKIEDITLEHAGGNASLKGQQGVRCVEVHEGDLELNNCDVTCNVGSGVMLLEQAYLKVKKSRINDNGRCGIISFDESRLDCEDSQFKVRILIPMHVCVAGQMGYKRAWLLETVRGANATRTVRGCQ